MVNLIPIYRLRAILDMIPTVFVRARSTMIPKIGLRVWCYSPLIVVKELYPVHTMHIVLPA